MTTWYTTAWFDKYLKHDPTADARLLTARWRNDAAGGAADPSHDRNLYSYHYLSRLQIHLTGGTRVDCENLRNGCAWQPAAGDDCGSARVLVPPDRYRRNRASRLHAVSLERRRRGRANVPRSRRAPVLLSVRGTTKWRYTIELMRLGRLAGRRPSVKEAFSGRRIKRIEGGPCVAYVGEGP